MDSLKNVVHIYNGVLISCEEIIFKADHGGIYL